MEPEVHVPTINIQPLLAIAGSIYTEEDRAATASSLLQACESHGLFFVTGHGITQTRRQLAFDNSRRFFSLPEATKRKIPAKKGGFTRGYIGFGGESGSHLLECKEAFSYGYPWPEDEQPKNALQGCNIWPEGTALGDAWREDMTELFRQMVAVNEAVSLGLSLCRGIGLEDLPTLCRGGDTISLLRLFHYFPYRNDANPDSNTGVGDCQSGEHPDPGARGGEEEAEAGGAGAGSHQEGQTSEGKGSTAGSAVPEPGKIGSSPHTDWGLSTSILQDGAGGLQFLEQKTQRWIDVPCPEDALVFNCGDYLSLLSKGRLKSPVHQVVTTGVERTSFVFFYYPNFEATLPAAIGGAANMSGTANETDTSTNDDAGGGGGGGGGAPPGEARRQQQQRGERVGYNTLLDLKRESNGATEESFGQYLAKKWGDVFRD